MADLAETNDALRPPTTTSIPAPLEPRRTSSSAGSRSRSSSRARSRDTSFYPRDTAAANDASESARDAVPPESVVPVKREHSSDTDRGEAEPSSTSIRDEHNGPPSPKRRRMDTDSVEELLDNRARSASSLLAAESADATSKPRSHAAEPSTHVAQADDPPHRPEATDADVSLNEVVVVHPSSSETGAHPSNVRDAPQRSRSATHTSASGQPAKMQPQPLSSYNCPICFSPPRYATMTPCGHICCGECLFTAVKATIERSQYHGPASQLAKCPVCRAPIPGWDGMGGGVIGLKSRFVYDMGGNSSSKSS